MPNDTSIIHPYFCPSIWPLDVPVIHLITFGISQAISFPITVAANAILIYALLKTGQSETISNKFIVMMSLSDLCMGIFGQPAIIVLVSIKDVFRSCALEKSVEYIVFVSANFSWFMLLLISVDRYFQVTKLNRYNEYMNPVRMKVAVLVSFVTANGLAVILLLVSSFTLQIIFNVANILMMTFVATLYAYMMRRLAAHNEKLAAAGKADVLKNSRRHLMVKEAPKSDESEQDVKQQKANARESQKQLSALRTIRMLIVAIFALYGPYNVASTYWTYYKFGKRINPALGLNIFVLWAYFIVLTNAAANACIIINGNSKTRRFVLSKLRFFSQSKNKVLFSSEQTSTSQVTATKT